MRKLVSVLRPEVHIGIEGYETQGENRVEEQPVSNWLGPEFLMSGGEYHGLAVSKHHEKENPIVPILDYFCALVRAGLPQECVRFRDAGDSCC